MTFNSLSCSSIARTKKITHSATEEILATFSLAQCASNLVQIYIAADTTGTLDQLNIYLIYKRIS